jgi:DNA polymerase III epsilon subunit family exonuclease
MGDRIVEVGVVVCRGGREVGRFSRLLNPQRDIPTDAQRIHGITDADVAACPPFQAVADELTGLLDRSWVVGHNVRFDVGFLAMELALAGCSVEPAGCFDTCQLAATTWDLPNYQLDTVAGAVGVKRGQLHRALADAEAARIIFDRVMEELGGSSQVGVAELQALHTYVPTWPTDPRRSLPGPLYDALTSGRPILIQYVNSEGVSSSRTIRPNACFPVGPHLYLRARCAQAGEMRTFRLDRIMEITGPLPA